MLAVVMRELRAEARHPFTYWLRVLGAGAMVLAAGYGLLQGGLPMDRGGELFARLHLLLYGSIWVLVPLVTADCISRERREGALPLLFLTPLNAQGIVLAKALAHCLRAVTLCLAVLPVMAIPILMGGVSWQEVFLSIVFNFSAFCWALAAGLIGSARCRVWARAIVMAMVLSTAFACVFGLTDCALITAFVWRHLPGGPPVLRTLTLGDLSEAVAFWPAGWGGLWKGALVALPVPAQSGLLLAAASSGAISMLAALFAVALAAGMVSRRWQERSPS